MTSFAVDVPALAQAAAATRTIGTDLGAELDRLRTEAEGVLAGAWLGRAADTFDRTWTQWHRGARDVVVALEDLAAGVADCERAYDVSDGTAAGGLRLAAP